MPANVEPRITWSRWILNLSVPRATHIFRRRKSAGRNAPRWVAVKLVAVLFVACDQQAPGPTPKLDHEKLRIVSFAPAITQMLVDLGASDGLVAVAKNDDAAPSKLPVVGTYVDPDLETLLALAPTHVLMMTGKEGAPRRMAELAATGRFRLITYPSPANLEDVGRILHEEQESAHAKPAKSLGAVLGATERARKLKYRMLVELGMLSELFADAGKPRVLMVLATNPIMASGPGTVHDQLLRKAGASNAAAKARVGAPTYDRESLLGIDPELILLLLPRAEPLQGLDHDPRLASFRGLPIKAVRDGRIVLINDPLVLLPSSSLSRIAVAMAKAVHPDMVDQIDEVLSRDTDGADAMGPTANGSSESSHVDD